MSQRRRASARQQMLGRAHAIALGARAQEQTYTPAPAPAPRVIGGETRVTAPSVLSMRYNPEACVRFFAELDATLKARKRTSVNLNDVRQMHYDGIVTLLSHLVRFRSAGVAFSGIFPKSPAAKRILTSSGFFEALYTKEFEVEDEYTFGGESEHFIGTHAKKGVDAKFTAELIRRTTPSVWGATKRSQGTQRVLLELMLNTQNHANPNRPGEKHWFVSVNPVPGNRQASFTFVDLGVGIFGSLDDKPFGSWLWNWRAKVERWLEGKNDADVLRAILTGELRATVTGERFRGRGLPGIAKELERGWISELVIVTNNVYADVSRGEYRLLHRDFRGTFVSWQINAGNRHSDQIQ